MPKLDGTGSEGNGSKTGRGLGKSSTANGEEKLQKLGKGIGKKRKTGGGTGHGNRLKSGLKDC